MIRILLVDDQSLFRELLQILLEVEKDFEVVGRAHNGKMAIEQVELLKPDVVLIDIEMPEMDGLTATQIICKHFPEVKIIVLSSYDDEAYLANAFKAGAKGYLLKNTKPAELAGAIRSVYNGFSQVGPGLLQKLMTTVADPNDLSAESASSQSNKLTLPEPELMLLLKSFEPEKLLEIVERILQSGGALVLLNRLAEYLKEDPVNLSALYLTGTLTYKAKKEPQLAFDYLRFGFKEAIEQKLPRTSLLLFYREGASIKPDDAFKWITQVDSPWNADDGLSFLLQESAQLFGLESLQYHSLHILERIRTIDRLSDSWIDIGKKLKVLERGFDRLVRN